MPIEIDARAIARSQMANPLLNAYREPVRRDDTAEQRVWGGRPALIIRARDGQLRAHDQRTGSCLGAVVDEHDAALVADLRQQREREGTGGAIVGAAVAAAVGLLFLVGLFYAGFQVGRTYERRPVAAERAAR